MEKHRIPTPKEITSYLKRPLRDASAIVFAVDLALSLPSSPTELQFAARIAQASDCGPIKGEGRKGIIDLEAVTSREEPKPGDEGHTELRLIFKDVVPPGARAFVVDTIANFRTEVDISNLLRTPALSGPIEWFDEAGKSTRAKIDPTHFFGAEVIVTGQEGEEKVLDIITPSISPLQGCFPRTR